MSHLYSSEFRQINGHQQYLSIRSAGNHKPILLYLHGGPGDAALPLVAKYNSALEEYFTVVVWEQRGTGKSYYPFSAHETVTIAQFVDDLEVITQFLLQKYQQEKLYLVGHSWGSVLGLKFCQRHPEWVHAYVGCGQVVNMKKSSRAAYEYVVREAEKRENHRVLNKLRTVDCSYKTENWLEDLMFVTRLVVKYGGSFYGHTSYNQFVKEFIFSREYSLKDLLKRQRGSLQSIKRLWPELMTVDFENVTAFSVPVNFVEGRHDYHVSAHLVYDYFQTISTPKNFFWFERSCHFPQWSEAEKFTECMRSIREATHLREKEGRSV